EGAIEWSKFYYGLDLAHAFSETAEPRFLAAWERLVRSWIRTVPVGSDPSHVAGRRIQNWIYAWNMFAAAPGFPGLSPGTAPCIAGSLAAQVRDLRARPTPARRHRTLALSGADGGSYLGPRGRAGGLLGHPDFLWASTAGGRGAPPEGCSPSFPCAGYFMRRSGWGPTARRSATSASSCSTAGRSATA